MRKDNSDLWLRIGQLVNIAAHVSFAGDLNARLDRHEYTAPVAARFVGIAKRIVVNSEECVDGVITGKIVELARVRTSPFGDELLVLPADIEPAHEAFF